MTVLIKELRRSTENAGVYSLAFVPLSKYYHSQMIKRQFTCLHLDCLRKETKKKQHKMKKIGKENEEHAWKDKWLL